MLLTVPVPSNSFTGRCTADGSTRSFLPIARLLLTFFTQTHTCRGLKSHKYSTASQARKIGKIRLINIGTRQKNIFAVY
ncbi:hypothetical protein GBAR_LOCUS3574, partial [Geodia barretti]